MRNIFKTRAVVLLVLLLSTTAHAATKAESRSLGTFGYWRSYSITEHGQPMCYMTLTARFPKNKNFLRGDALLTVTHRPAEDSKDVISYTAGYNYKPMSSADLTLGKTTFDLFTAQDTAWSRDPATDHKIAALLRTTPQLTIRGVPVKKGIGPLTDHFPLKGAAEAYRAISKACGIELEDKAATAPKAQAKKPRPH